MHVILVSSVLEIKGNFISIRKLTQKGYEVKFYAEKADIIYNGRVIATAKIKNQLYKLTDSLYGINEIKNKKRMYPLLSSDFWT